MRRRMVLAMLVLPTVVACARKGRYMMPRSDDDLNAKLRELSVGGGSAPLHTLTSFDWDAVYCCYQGVNADRVNAAVGATVLEPDSYPWILGALAVFIKDGRVVKVLDIPELSFTAGRQPDGVVVQGRRLVEPSDRVSGTCCSALSPAAAAPNWPR